MLVYLGGAKAGRGDTRTSISVPYDLLCDGAIGTPMNSLVVSLL